MNKLAQTMLKPVVWPTSVKMHAYWDETFENFINLARYGNDLQTICFENIINEQTFDPADAFALKWLPDAQAYWIDAAQRAILFMDILRKRGDNFLDNIKKGQPPVLTAERLKWMHPMRGSRHLFSSGNPFMQPFSMMAPVVKETRRARSEDNIFTQLEKQTSHHLTTMLNTYRDIRDAADEFMFKTIYRNPWLKAALDASGPDEAPDAKPRDSEISSEERKKWLSKINKGGIQAGIVRTIVLMAGADRVFDEREFETAAEIVRQNKRFAKVAPADFKALAHEQARILQFDEERAVNALRWLLPHQTHRKEVYEMAEKIAMADFRLADEEKVMLARLKAILQIDSDEAEEPEPENLSQAPEERMVEALMASSVHRDQAES